MTEATSDPLGEYRTAVQTWLQENVSPGDAVPSAEEARQFQSALFDAGYAGITWPKEWGGQGLSQLEAQIFNEESSRHIMPNGPLAIGLHMVGPTILQFGTDKQKSHHIRAILSGEHVWCQLFSEPGAGSDLASLQTRAVEDGDGWIINGHKVWSSSAHIADYGLLLARTDPDAPKHEGLTMFLIDLRQPGVRVRPLRDMTGYAPFNEVYLDNARVSSDGLIGQVNGGWEVASATLAHERFAQANTKQNRSRGVTFEALRASAQRVGRSGDPVVRAALVDVWLTQRANDLFSVRLRQEARAGANPGASGSVGKVAGAMHILRAAALVSTILGKSAIAWQSDDPRAVELALGLSSAPASSLAGGTNEIQKSIIAERILGLPREPRVDQGTPFSQVRRGSV